MIRLEGITKVYRSSEVEVYALRDIHLQIRAGEFVAVMGPSGSGKTTLLDILGCLSKPTSGRYYLEGQEAGSLNDSQLAQLRNRKIGFIFQGFHLLSRNTALENVQLPLLYAGVEPEQRKKMAMQALASVDLSNRVHHRPHQLSGGQQQRVAIARAVVNHPAILLADEPTGNLDTAFGQEILNLLKALHAEKHTIILVTHDRELAAQADRTIRRRDGQLTLE